MEKGVKLNENQDPACPLCGSANTVFLGKIAEAEREEGNVWLLDYGCRCCRKSNVLVATQRTGKPGADVRWFGDIVGWENKARTYFLDLT